MTKPLISFQKNIIVLGYGSIAQAVLPLIQKHFAVSASQIHVLSQTNDNPQLLADLNVQLTEITFTKQNLHTELKKYASEGDLLVNLTAGISSIDLMSFCQQNNVLYLDTCIEMWPEDVSPESTTYDDRRKLLEYQEASKGHRTTALSSMGANPGIVSLLSKQSLLLMNQKGQQLAEPKSKNEWGDFAQALGVRAVHVNERDTQYTDETVGKNDFFSTWSPEAMIIESIEPAEMSLGSHEKMPANATLSGDVNQRDIYFQASGKDVQIYTWLPLAKKQTAFILNHNEPMSLAELYTSSNGEYSPTTCFAYHPSEQTMTSLENLTKENYLALNNVLMLEHIKDGHDELGVLTITASGPSFWLGSRLNITTARKINPWSSATSLQVAGGVLAGMCWVAEHPDEGVCEPEDIAAFIDVLKTAEPYWGGYVEAETHWPHSDRDDLSFSSFLV